MLQGGVVGFLIGILPGAGSTVASFVSYIIAKKTSKTPEEFGKGSIEGVAAPEAANNSETGGAMVPLLTMGIPGSGTGAVLLGALVLYGLNPGPLLFQEHADVVWPIIASMYLGNIALLVMNLPMVPFFAKLLNTPYKVLYPAILLISVVGVYSVNFSIFDVGLLVVFGLLGYAMRKLDIPPAPLVLAFVLGPIAENSIRQSLLLSDNSPIIYLQRPISAVLIGVAVAAVAGADVRAPDPQGARAGHRNRRIDPTSRSTPIRKESDMIRIRKLLTVVLAAVALVALAACGSGGGGGGGGKSGPVEVVTHNAVGGGSDVFTRQMIKVMYENKIIDTNWPVRNVPAGDSIGAMSYMVDRKGNAGLIAQVTPTWLATPMTVANAKVSLADLTPITLVATEPQVIVTNAKSQFNSFADFVNAAKAAPDTLVQAGGSSTANDALTRLVLQDTSARSGSSCPSRTPARGSPRCCATTPTSCSAAPPTSPSR